MKLRLVFRLHPIRGTEENLHNIVNKRVQFTYIQLVTITVWSDTLLRKLQSTRRIGNLCKNLKSR